MCCTCSLELNFHISFRRTCSTNIWSPKHQAQRAKSSTWRWRETTSATWLRWLPETRGTVNKTDVIHRPFFLTCRAVTQGSDSECLCSGFMKTMRWCVTQLPVGGMNVCWLGVLKILFRVGDPRTGSGVVFNQNANALLVLDLQLSAKMLASAAARLSWQLQQQQGVGCC